MIQSRKKEHRGPDKMVGGVEIEIWIFAQALMARSQMQVVKRLAAQKRGTGDAYGCWGEGGKGGC
jgi:hypothetical protein